MNFNMLGKNLYTLLRGRSSMAPKFQVPKRNWTQVGMHIGIPSRIKCSYGEMLLHIVFMYTVWLSPMAFFLSQLKVWRREYIQQ